MAEAESISAKMGGHFFYWNLFAKHLYYCWLFLDEYIVLPMNSAYSSVFSDISCHKHICHPDPQMRMWQPNFIYHFVVIWNFHTSSTRVLTQKIERSHGFVITSSQKKMKWLNFFPGNSCVNILWCFYFFTYFDAGASVASPHRMRKV